MSRPQQGQRAPINSVGTVEFHRPAMDSQNVEEIHDERLLADFVEPIEKIQQQNYQFNEAAGTADLFASIDGEGNDLMRHFITEMDGQFVTEMDGQFVTAMDQQLVTEMNLNNRDILSYADPIFNDLLRTGLFEGSNTDVGQAEINFGDDTRKNSNQTPADGCETGFGVGQSLATNAEMLDEKAERQEQTVKKSSVKETESIRIQSALGVIRTGSTDNLPQLTEVKSDRLESTRVHNVAADKDPVAVADKSKNALYCPVCDKAYSRQGDLKRHLRIHTGEKPFKCGECGIVFHVSRNLKRHRATVHSGAESFKCSACNAAFSRNNQLLIHLLTHTNEKEFHCNICQRSFWRKETLLDHKKTHSGYSIDPQPNESF